MSGYVCRDMEFYSTFGLEDPPENKELPDPSGSLSRVALSRVSALSLITSCIVVKVANQSASQCQTVSLKCYTKLTSTQTYEIGKKGAEISVTVAIRYYNKHISPRIS